MKFWSLPTLGVVVGIFNILALAYVGLLLIFAVSINITVGSDLSETNKTLANVIFCIVLVLCSVMATLSGCVIKGIVKRRHVLMVPWLQASPICLFLTSISLIFMSDIIRVLGLGPVANMSVYIVGCLVIGLYLGILYIINRLYKDIRAKNYENLLQIVRGGQMDNAYAYKSQDNLLDNCDEFIEISPKNLKSYLCTIKN